MSLVAKWVCRSVPKLVIPDRYPPQLVDYLKHHGSQKVLVGSNYPMITPAKALASLDSLGLDETARSCFLEDNA